MTGERPAHQQAGVRRHGDWPTRGPVDPADLTVGNEAAPHLLERGEPPARPSTRASDARRPRSRGRSSPSRETGSQLPWLWVWGTGVTRRGTVVGTGNADQVRLGSGGDVDAGRRHRIRVRRRRGCVDRHPAGKAGEGDAAGGRDRTPRPSGGVRITAAVGSHGHVRRSTHRSRSATSCRPWAEGHRGTQGHPVRAAAAHRSPSR